MFRPNKLLLSLSLFLVLLLAYPSLFAQEESITMTTYYPSPYGSYREMRAKRMAIGDTYIEGETYSWDTLPATINADADLVVEGNVGIGTTEPISKLEIYGGSEQSMSIRGTGDVSMQLRSTGVSGEVYYELADGINTASNSWKIGTNDDGKLHFGYGAVNSMNSNEKVTITTDGNVGIGSTTNPGTWLFYLNTDKDDLAGFKSSDDNAYIMVADNDTSAYLSAQNNLIGLGHSSTIGTLGIVIKNDGNVGIGTTNPLSKLSVGSGGVSNAAIYSDGANLGLTRGIYATGASQGIVSVGTNMGVEGSSPANWGIYCSAPSCGGTANWTNNSDVRLKNNIIDLSANDGLDAIMKLRPITFHWKDSNLDRIKGEQLGFIAQEVQSIFPQLVVEDKVGSTTITFADGSTQVIENSLMTEYSGFVVPLVKAIQEQQQEIEGLKLELQRLKEKL